MRLVPHPAVSPDARLAIEAGARRAAGSIEVEWWLRGDLSALRIPKPAPRRRVEGLWRHTCFEAFVGAAGGGAYCELNFSPSGAWAAYRPH